MIDTHSHWIPPSYARALEDEGRNDPGVEATRQVVKSAQGGELLPDLEARFVEMDEAGVDIAVISIPPPGIGFGDPGRSAHAAQQINDELIAAAERYPDRLRVMVTLPLPHPDESIAEVARIAEHPLVRGVELFGVTTRYQTDDPMFRPVLAAIADAGLVAQLHPAFEPPAEAMRAWGLGGSLGAVTGNSLAGARMILSGALDEVANLELIVTHLAGVLPYLVTRFDDLSGTGDAQHNVEFYLRNRIWTDNCSYHAPALRCAVQTMGADRIMTGSDYPFRGPVRRCIDDVKDAGLSDHDAHLILHETASRWFA